MHWIKNIVKELTEKRKTIDPFELAAHKKIHVVFWDLHEEIKGFYKYDRRNKYIFINSNLDTVTQKFVCAHELGHSQLHPRVNTPFLREKTFLSIDRIEVEANTFAVELLLPDSSLYEFQDSFLSLQEIAALHSIPNDIAHLKKMDSCGLKKPVNF